MTTATAFSALTGDYVLDPAHTRIGFVARHAMVTQVRGAFNEFTGTAHADGENVERSAVEVVIRVASIDTRNADRDAHLRSADFLGLDAYPEITFRSTEVVWNGEDAFDVTGDLTVKGVTRPVTVPHLRGPGDRPVRQRPCRLRVLDDDQPQGPRHDLERCARDRRGAGRRQVVLEFGVSAIRQSLTGAGISAGRGAFWS